MLRFFQFLQTSEINTVVSRQQLLEACKWKESTLATYLTKNKLAAFVIELPDGRFRVIRAGPALKQIEVKRALTQVTPEGLALFEEDRLQGARSGYILKSELGRGAVGHVWKAEDDNGTSVAIKVLNPRPDLLEPTSFANVKRRFKRESGNGVKLSHAGIVRHIDNGEHQKQPFLVMELAERSCADVLKTVGPVSDAKAAEIVRAALEGLSFLHGEGCVHRDVKPANLLIMDRGVVLGDLGIVKWGDLNASFTSAATLTRASVQLGSWFYMAPEQLADPHEAVAASDIYALGVTWFELLTGRTLSPAAFAAQQIPTMHCRSAVRDLILAMTQFAPDARPSALSLADSIDDL